MTALVEKHFPAPDRDRVHRILGIDTKKSAGHSSSKSNGQEASKRKSCMYSFFFFRNYVLEKIL